MASKPKVGRARGVLQLAQGPEGLTMQGWHSQLHKEHPSPHGASLERARKPDGKAQHEELAPRRQAVKLRTLDPRLRALCLPSIFT